ncbi:MAG: apolipoprotein N-acyltransferase [Firmicutes bacterium]|nr:apolipoprotein N-acyltransferase [Bacillota bacterium]
MKPGNRKRNKYSCAALPLLTAFLLILSFSAPQRGALGWICLLPLFFYLYNMDSSWQKCFWGGTAGGVVFFLHHYAYMALSISFLYPRYFSIMVVFATALYSALFWGLFSLAAFFILQNKRILLPTLGLSSAWILGEFLRSWGFLGHTGGFLGYTQAHFPLLLQCISLYGYWGLSFIMVFAQALLFLLWRSRRENDRREGKQREIVLQESGQQEYIRRESSWVKYFPRVIFLQGNIRRGSVLQDGGPRIRCNHKHVREIFVSLLIFLALLGGGLYLPSLFPVEKYKKPLRVALIQGNIPQEDILDPALSLQNFQKYLAFSRRAHALHAPLDLIVWPETVFSAGLGKNHYSTAVNEIAALATETDTSILFGAVYEEQKEGAAGNNERHIYNSILLQKSGKNSWEEERYDKIKLVPFAEYLPYPDLLQSFGNLNISLGAYTPGSSVQRFDLEDYSIGGIVCFESYFAQPARNIVQKGSRHLFILTNDAWFLDSDGLAQHARVAKFRALETGIGVTQVANTGHTVSYDPLGREIVTLPILQEGIVLLETEMPRRQTLYRLGGNYFLYPCLLLLVAACRPSSKALKRKITGGG